eukprot:m.242177 g.242177  ORF g.242177 m.242177 type:complete len:1048 (-) comp33791_c2_seq1:202-3345(-)
MKPNSEEFPIKISLRVRPRNKAEIVANSPSVVKCPEGNKAELQVKTAGKIDSRTYTYDNVFTPESTQLEVYDSVVAPCLEEVLQGYNCTVFAYGQTGTGKTHTMEGVRTNKVYDSYTEDPDAGLIPRALQHLFEKLESGSATEYVVKVSFLEIYNEEIFDLLSDDLSEEQKKLRLFEDSNRKGSVIIQGLEEVMVHGKNDIYKILQKGAEKRRTAETKMNKASSRSHSVFSVTVHLKENSVEGEELLKSGKLYLVDLAGAENIGRSGAVKDRAREAGNINTSLLTLGRVISKLVERAAHIPYRESKLTRLLQDSLGGRTKTSIIATVSPAQINMEETQSTMEYAARAKNILNRPEVNQKVSKRMVIKHYTEEIERLKRDLLCAREKDGIFMTEERFSGLNNQIESQTQIIEELEGKVTNSVTELKKITELFDTTSTQLEETAATLETTEKQLVTTENKLEETESTLATTVVEKEEKSFLLEAQVATEKSLQQNASKLLQVTETTTSHIDALHRKVQRKDKVEQDNFQASKHNAKAVDTEMTVMAERMATFKETQGNDLEHMRTSARGFVQSVQSQLSSLASVMDTLSQSLQGATTITARATDQTQSSLDINAEELKKSAITFGVDISDKSSKHRNQNFQPIFNRFQDILNSQKVAADLFAQSMIQHCETANQRLDNFATTSSANVESLRVSVKSHLAHEASSVNTHRTQINHVMDEHKTSTESAMSLLQAQIGNMLTDFVANQSLALESNIENVQSDLAEQVSTNLSFGDTFVAECEAADETLAVFCKSETETINAVATVIADRQASTASEFKTIDASMESINLSVVDYDIDLSTTAKALSQLQCLELVKLTDECHSDLIDVVNVSTKLNTEQSQACASLQDITTLTTTQLSQGAANLDDQLSTFAIGANSEFESTISQISETSSKLVEQIRNGFRGDESTGETPQQRRYYYPKKLPITRPHDVLLAEFRTQKETETSTTDDNNENNENNENTSTENACDSPTITFKSTKKLGGERSQPGTPLPLINKAFTVLATPVRHSPLSHINQ